MKLSVSGGEGDERLEEKISLLLEPAWPIRGPVSPLL